jgi:hypothetical protein
MTPFSKRLKNIWSGAKRERIEKVTGSQDDGFAEGTEEHLVAYEKREKIEKVTGSQDDAFFEGTEKYLVGCKNAKGSKKSQALRMTILWEFRRRHPNGLN